jgi:hypothetical protein
LRDANDQRLLSRYLLEDIGEEERERLEEDYLADDDLYMRLMVAEDELIAAYVQGELSRRDRAKFEKAYLTNPRRLQKVESTRELLYFFSEKKAQPAPRPGLLTVLRQWQWGGLRPLYVVVGLLLLAVPCVLSGWLLIERRRMQGALEAARERLRQAESEQQLRMSGQTPTPTPTPTQVRDMPPTPGGDSTPEHASDTAVERETQRHKRDDRPVPDRGRTVENAPSSVLAFALPRPGTRTRGGSGHMTEPLVIPRGVVLVRLTVKVIPNDYAAYTVSLQKLGGSEGLTQVVPRSDSSTSGESVGIDVPASVLTNGVYTLRVVGADETLALHQVRFDKQIPPRK